MSGTVMPPAGAQPAPEAACAAAPAFCRTTASFRDRALEAAYRRHLSTHALPRERNIWLLMALAYFLYGALDILTISEQLPEVLIARWAIFTPIALALYGLTFVPKVKPYASLLFTFGVFLSAISIVWMISILPAQGSPPYIIGVLVVFIFSSCNVQMPFPAAGAAFFLTTLAYSLVLFGDPRFTRIDIISGLFFMMSSAGVAALTNYVQEIRLRVMWFNDERSRRDAKRIEELMIEATASDQSKINFLSILSHELRTPLHQIIGFSEVLRASKDGRDPARTSEYLDDIHTSAHRLLGSIAKMLRYADATAGKIAYNLDRYEVSEIVELAVDQFSARAAQREITLDAAEIAAAAIRVDQASTTYALGCLIDNAVNASPAHSRISIAGVVRAGGHYELSVADQGIGMTAEQIRVAFEPFSQTSGARTRASEGVGLGLTLARKILTDQGADLSLASEPGRGTVARIIFKVEAKVAAA